MDKYRTLLSAVMIHIVIGSVYAWSILVIPLQEVFGGVSTGMITSIFSVAIFSLGAAACYGGTLIAKYGTELGVTIAGALYTTGIIVSYAAITFNMFWLLLIGYGVLCGASFGFGYISPIVAVRDAFPGQKSIVSGVVIMSFGLGATVNAYIMNALLPHGVGYAVLVAGVIYSVILFVASFGFEKGAGKKVYNFVDKITVNKIIKTNRFVITWLMFCMNITSGLALISLAVPMFLLWNVFDPKSAVLFVSSIGICNALGRVAVGVIAERFESKTKLFFNIICGTMAAFIIMTLFQKPEIFVALTLYVAALYGAGFAIMPSVAEEQFGAKLTSIVHGNYLSAWSIAGVIGPIIMGGTFLYHNGFMPIYIILALQVLSLIVSLGIVTVRGAEKD